MACSACSQRKTGRIIPVNPNKPKTDRVSNTNTDTPTSRGNTTISALRYTGR